MVYCDSQHDAQRRKLHAGRELTDELPTKSCLFKFQFPVNEAAKPGLQVADVIGRIWVTEITTIIFVYYNILKRFIEIQRNFAVSQNSVNLKFNSFPK